MSILFLMGSMKLREEQGVEAEGVEAEGMVMGLLFASSVGVEDAAVIVMGQIAVTAVTLNLLTSHQVAALKTQILSASLEEKVTTFRAEM